MYAEGNPRTKKQLREWVAEGRKVAVFQPGPYPTKTRGRVAIEGPHFPSPHAWYAQVLLADGVIVKVLK